MLRRQSIALKSASIALLFAAVLCATPPAHAQAPQWQYVGLEQSDDPTRREAVLLIHGIPETDASDVVMRCMRGTNAAEIAFVSSQVAVGQDPVTLRLVAGNFISEQPAVRASEDLANGAPVPAFSFPLDSLVWKAMESADTLQVTVADRENLTIGLAGFSRAMQRFIKDCSSNEPIEALATASAAAGEDGAASQEGAANGRDATSLAALASAGQPTGRTATCTHPDQRPNGQWSVTRSGAGAIAAFAECDTCEMGLAVMCDGPGQPVSLMAQWAAVSLGQDGAPITFEICVDGQSVEYHGVTEEQGLIGYLPRMPLLPGNDLISKLKRGSRVAVSFAGRTAHMNLRGSSRALATLEGICGRID